MTTIIMESGVDTDEFDRLVSSTVQAMRHSLGVSGDELAKASGIPSPRIEAIERGGTTTRSERHDIANAVAWLSNHARARALVAGE
ncbi:MAG: helix-turn-helix transcriptional regulator [Dermatophilaceae bacterium]